MRRKGDSGSKVRCAICGNTKRAHETWFSVTEDCELDRLRVWRWNLGFARSLRAHNICGRRHLRELIVHWMTTSCLRYPFAMDLRVRAAGKVSYGPDIEREGHLHQLAELTVDRGSVERVLAENPCSLNVIFDELMIALESESADDELYSFDEPGFAVGGF
jgi:hypothetical protein